MKKEEKKETPEKTTPGFNVTVNEDITESWPEKWDYNLTNAKSEKEKPAAIEVITEALQKETRELYPDAKNVNPIVLDHNLRFDFELKGKRTGVFFVENVQEGELVTSSKTGKGSETIKPQRGRLVVITGAETMVINPTPAANRNVLIFTF